MNSDKKWLVLSYGAAFFTLASIGYLCAVLCFFRKQLFGCVSFNLVDICLIRDDLVIWRFFRVYYILGFLCIFHGFGCWGRGGFECLMCKIVIYALTVV